MSGYIILRMEEKYVLFNKDDSVLVKYNDIWNKIKKKLNTKFYSIYACDGRYVKANVTEFNSIIKTNFLDDKIRKESLYHTCICCKTIDFVMRIEEKSHPQVYLEECKFKIKSLNMSEFIDTKLESDFSSDSESL